MTWALWPPTSVTLATLSLEEAAPGLVGMECGVGRLQCVSVSLWNGFFIECIDSHTEVVTCSDLTLTNGNIVYTKEPPNNRPIYTVATHTCDTGYTLTGGNSNRFCTDMGGGKWTGSARTCESEFCNSYMGGFQYRHRTDCCSTHHLL